MKSIQNVAKIIYYLLAVLSITNFYAQQKRVLTPKDYKLWSTLNLGVISGDGNWVAYHILHQNTKDTLYLKNINTDIIYNYPSVTTGIFSTDSKWFGFIKGDSLNLQNLNSGKKYIFANIARFSFTAGSRYLLLYGKNEAAKTLWLNNLKTFTKISIKNVEEYSLNPDNTILGVIKNCDGNRTVETIILKNKIISRVLISNKIFNYTGLTWSKLGASLAFYDKFNEGDKNKNQQKAYLCRNILDNPIIKILNPLITNGFPKDSYIELSRRLYVSDDSKQLFIYLQKKIDSTKLKVTDQNAVQVWLSEDKKLPPLFEHQNELNPQWCVWWPDNDKIMTVEDAENPNVILTGDQKRALVYSTDDYLPQHDYGSKYIDLYIKDLFTGEKKIIIKKQINEYQHILVSPTGRYITYFKEKNWWVYDIYLDTHKCITTGLNISLENINYDWAGAKPPYGNPGWFDNDSAIIVYDQFDIWLISPNGSKKIKITDGRKSNVTYRIFDTEYRTSIKTSFFGFIANSFDENKGIFITTLDNNTLQQGFCYWNKKSGLKELMKKDSKIYPLSDFNPKKTFLFLESNFDLAPRIMVLNPSGKEQIVFQSNPQQKEFYWGKSELINYTVNEKQLKGALFYPANYVSGKKYPMIVYIYEKRSSELHNYTAPSESIEHGFNPTNFTTNGYFVLQPDIAYELNDPGISATRCVVTAVEKVLNDGLIDKNKIGLMGFSFGGYETSFIITQTNLFKAAVAGSGFTDLIDFYLSTKNGNSNMWRFENQQQRLQSPFYGKDFERNSTILNAQNINTPLLLWTGDQDLVVDCNHSKKLQMALWRLHKKSTLLIYPEEGHGLFIPANQIDLTLRVKKWFDYYLKGDDDKI